MSPAGSPSPPPPPETPRILVVEDEEALREGLRLNLERKGYAVEVARDGEEGLARARERPDLIVLDVRMPKVDGFEVCRRIRADGQLVPILMLTARDQPDDVVFGLKTGADDYMVKPFDLAVFLARVEGLLRRADWTRQQEGATGRFEFGEFWVDFDSWRASTRDGEVELSRKEIEVMRIFSEKPDQVVTRRELLDRVWELPNHPNTRVVDNVIVSLRKAFEDDAWKPKHIHNVRGVGYRFVP